MNTGRYCHTSSVLGDGKVLVTGGYESSNSTFSAAGLYDPATGLWNAAGLMSIAGDSHTASVLGNGIVLISGGWNGTRVSNTLELYYP